MRFQFTRKCKTCNRQLLHGDVIFGGCAYCFKKRFESGLSPQFETDGYNYLCHECHEVIPFEGYIQWDVTSAMFILLCSRCSEHKEQLDAQFKNTEFAYRKRLQ